MKKICTVCGKEYEALRSSSTVCSSACRKAKSRGKVSVTESPEVILAENAEETENPYNAEEERTKRFLAYAGGSKTLKEGYEYCKERSMHVPNWITTKLGELPF
jgi:hypothetical protein